MAFSLKTTIAMLETKNKGTLVINHLCIATASSLFQMNSKRNESSKKRKKYEETCVINGICFHFFLCVFFNCILKYTETKTFLLKTIHPKNISPRMLKII